MAWKLYLIYWFFQQQQQQNMCIIFLDSGIESRVRKTYSCPLWNSMSNTRERQTQNQFLS